MAEPARVKIKKPYVERGKRWNSYAVSKLFLEDVEYIFWVMDECSENSPYYQRSKEIHERRMEIRRGMLERREKQGATESAEPLSPIEPLDPPVKIEVDDTLIVHTIEDLVSLNLGGIGDFSIGVGAGDLAMDCGSSGARLRTSLDDEYATTAFNLIQKRIMRREIPIIRYLAKPRIVGTWLLAQALSMLLGIFVRGEVMTYLSLSLALGSLFFVIFTFGYAFRSRIVVVPVHSRNVAKPWYAGTEMKVAIVAVILAGIITWWFSRGSGTGP